ncbi:MAG: hypothetical protein H0T84_04370 [Tatlockia sp.]|nr:hypothetical protein [Tatlockia sp.]
MTFNEFFSFIFINSKINTLLFALTVKDNHYQLSSTLAIMEAEESKAIYKKQIRRYLGLGFFLSFIPGTEPFLARKALLSSILILESLDRLGGQKAIEWFDTNIFIRTFFSILYHNFKTDFVTILLKKDDKFAGINRLNPFFYPTKLVFTILEMTSESLHKLYYAVEELPPILKIFFYPVLSTIVLIFVVAIIIELFLYYVC